MNINNTSSSYITVTASDGSMYQVPPYQTMMVNEPLSTGKPKLSLRDTTFLHRVTANDPEAKEVISKMLPHFCLEV